MYLGYPRMFETVLNLKTVLFRLQIVNNRDYVQWQQSKKILAHRREATKTVCTLYTVSNISKVPSRWPLRNFRNGQRLRHTSADTPSPNFLLLYSQYRVASEIEPSLSATTLGVASRDWKWATNWAQSQKLTPNFCPMHLERNIYALLVRGHLV